VPRKRREREYKKYTKGGVARSVRGRIAGELQRTRKAGTMIDFGIFWELLNGGGGGDLVGLCMGLLKKKKDCRPVSNPN